MVFGFGLFGSSGIPPPAELKNSEVDDANKDFGKAVEKVQLDENGNEINVDNLEENDEIEQPEPEIGTQTPGSRFGFGTEIDESEIGTEIDDPAEVSNSIKMLAESSKQEWDIGRFKIFARIIPVFWILSYYLTLYDQKEVSSKYFGFYFTGVSLIAIAAEKNPNFTIRLNNQRVLGPMEIFDMLLKFLFLTFVAFFTSAREQIGISGNSSFIGFSLMVFFFCVLIEVFPVMYNMDLENMVWENINVPVWRSNRLADMSKYYELHRKYAEPQLYFVKKLKSNVVMVFSSFSLLLIEEHPYVYLFLFLLTLVCFKEITQVIKYKYELDPTMKESICPVSFVVSRKVIGRVAEMFGEIVQKIEERMEEMRAELVAQRLQAQAPENENPTPVPEPEPELPPTENEIVN